MMCKECYSDNLRITPLIKSRECLENHIQYISNFIYFSSNYIHLISNFVLPGIYVLHQLAVGVPFQRRNSSSPSLDL